MMSVSTKSIFGLAPSKHLLTLLLGLTLSMSGCGADTQPKAAKTPQATQAEADTMSEKKKQLDIKIENPAPTKAPKQPREVVLDQQGAGFTAPPVMVYIGNGAVQCEFDGHSPSKTAADLEKTGAPVFKSFCGQRTGMMVTAMCGAGTTQINLHTIPGEWLQNAIDAGYKPVSDLARGNDKGYEIVECRSSSNDR